MIAVDQRLLVHHHLDDMVEHRSACRRAAAPATPPGRGAGIAVENEAATDIVLVEPLGKDVGDDLVRDELAGVHHRLG